MSQFVLDCSMTMAWCFEDEKTPPAEKFLGSLMAGSRALTPSIWPLEVANVLLVAERRKRITRLDTARYISLLQRLPIEIETESLLRTVRDVLTLGREQNLSAYDAAYLELALRKSVPLATLDKKLRQAAKRLHIPLATGQ
ncbi:MAG: type II toxin-antitoxin system VapC family toxin [bacterium]